MKIIRPIASQDYAAFEAFAFTAGLGIISLPRDPVLLHEKIVDSLEAFSEKKNDPHTILYLFVLEDLETHRLEGTCGIKAKTGGKDPIYFYKIENLEISSSLPSVPPVQKILKPVVYPEGPTEICGLYLFPESRKGGMGRLLSLSRFLFIACHPQRFDRTVFADMRGIFDNSKQNPFWEGIGRHFFDLPIEKALEMAIHDKSFIPDILPNYPLYISLLPPEIQNVIGQTHANTRPALKMLMEEGFQFTQEVNIFDGGPKIACETQKIRVLKESRVTTISEIVSYEESQEHVLISNTLLDFRACFSPLMLDKKQKIILKPEVAEALRVKQGEQIRYVSIPG